MSVVEHSATVIRVEQNKVFANIASQTACAACDFKNSCGLFDCKNKVIEIETPDAGQYIPGQEIMVELDESRGWTAVFFAYILPLILVLTVLFTTGNFTNDETAAAIYSLMVLIPYYLVLWLFKKNISRKFNFKISGKPPY